MFNVAVAYRVPVILGSLGGDGRLLFRFVRYLAVTQRMRSLVDDLRSAVLNRTCDRECRTLLDLGDGSGIGAARGPNVKIGSCHTIADDRRPPGGRAGEVLHAGPAGGLAADQLGPAACSLAGHGDSGAVLEDLDHLVREARDPYAG